VSVAATRDTPRRTQEERRTATRRALLDASLACLLEDGFAGLTTRRVAARAGVSPATQRVYFPTRASFVAAAVERLATELRREVDVHPQRDAPLWSICQGPTFQAMAELSAAARTDGDAQAGFAAAERAVTRQIVLAAKALFPEQLPEPRFRALVDLAVSSMLGLSMSQPLANPAALDGRWTAIRGLLIDAYAALPEMAA
jgi:AcrR family transcriptional regulator